MEFKSNETKKHIIYRLSEGLKYDRDYISCTEIKSRDDMIVEAYVNNANIMLQNYRSEPLPMPESKDTRVIKIRAEWKVQGQCIRIDYMISLVEYESLVFDKSDYLETLAKELIGKKEDFLEKTGVRKLSYKGGRAY